MTPYQVKNYFTNERWPQKHLTIYKFDKNYSYLSAIRKAPIPTCKRTRDYSLSHLKNSSSEWHHLYPKQVVDFIMNQVVQSGISNPSSSDHRPIVVSLPDGVSRYCVWISCGLSRRNEPSVSTFCILSPKVGDSVRCTGIVLNSGSRVYLISSRDRIVRTASLVVCSLYSFQSSENSSWYLVCLFSSFQPFPDGLGGIHRLVSLEKLECHEWILSPGT